VELAHDIFLSPDTNLVRRKELILGLTLLSGDIEGKLIVLKEYFMGSKRDILFFSEIYTALMYRKVPKAALEEEYGTDEEIDRYRQLILVSSIHTCKIVLETAEAVMSNNLEENLFKYGRISY
jgi:hypothetical protein